MPVELTTNLSQAFQLLIVPLLLRSMGIMRYGAIDASYWNWYSISLAFLAIEFLDTIGGFLPAGLILGWQINKNA